jgi:hypothetical protein
VDLTEHGGNLSGPPDEDPDDEEEMGADEQQKNGRQCGHRFLHTPQVHDHEEPDDGELQGDFPGLPTGGE